MDRVVAVTAIASLALLGACQAEGAIRPTPETSTAAPPGSTTSGPPELDCDADCRRGALERDKRMNKAFSAWLPVFLGVESQKDLPALDAAVASVNAIAREAHDATLVHGPIPMDDRTLWFGGYVDALVVGAVAETGVNYQVSNLERLAQYFFARVVNYYPESCWADPAERWLDDKSLDSIPRLPELAEFVCEVSP
jgi:hypothetical protein